MNKHILSVFLVLFAASSFAQYKLNGTVFSKSYEKGPKERVIGAYLVWENTRIFTATDTLGNFSIWYPDSLPASLVIMQTGFVTDTIRFTEHKNDSLRITLYSEDMDVVVIARERKATELSMFTPINRETLGQEEIRKSACCNLSESFETNPSVDVAFTDAVSGAKKIQMLGLDGVYSQILFENLPLIRGLSGAYGLSYIPGTWVESIAITKGTGSVVNGYESVSGQINVELQKPQTTKEKLFVNLYGSNKSRYEANIHAARKN